MGSYREEMLIADDVLFDNLDGETVKVYAADDSDAAVEHKAIQYASRVEDMDLPGADKTQRQETVRWSILDPSITLERGVLITQADNTTWEVYAVVAREFGVSTLVVAKRSGVSRRGNIRSRPLSGGAAR